jgi:hypothetical protein
MGPCMGLFEASRVTYFSIVVSWFDLAKSHSDGFEHDGAVITEQIHQNLMDFEFCQQLRSPH